VERRSSFILRMIWTSISALYVVLLPYLRDIAPTTYSTGFQLRCSIVWLILKQGFTDPLKGWNKMCCIAGKDTKAAYSRANSNDEDSTFKSPDHYIATTNTEKTVRFQFQVSVSRLGVLSGKKDSCKIYVTVQQIPY
jgi:hypothetical protein